ncbi:MAG: hypothetical protein KBF12_10615 [Sebaldella sp.]|nr:hypothetical protein [Sebaldella sp.]
MDKKIAQIVRYAGILSKIEPTEKSFYLDMLKGTKITTPASTIIYDAYVSKYVRAQLIGNDDKTKGNYAGREGFNRFKVTPGKIREYYQLTADEAAYIKAGELAYFNGVERKAEESIYTNVATYLKNAIISRMDLSTAELLSDGEYFADTGEKISFDIPAVKTKKKNDISDFKSFLRLMKEEINIYKRTSLDTPDRILIGEDIVNDLIDDEIFRDQVQKLGLGNIMIDDKYVAVAKVFNYLLLESEPIVGMDGVDIDIAKGNRMTLLSTKRLHIAHAGVDVLDSTGMPKKIAAEYIMRNDSDVLNATALFVGESAFTPIISNPKSVVRIDITK